MKQPPHILFVIVDDHQSACLGAHGNDVIQTPVIDRLAREGCDFQRAYIMGGCDPAMCVPSRAALLTATNPLTAIGLDPAQISLDTATVNPKLPLMPEWFRQAGWHTHGVGKWHNGRESFHRSFDSGAAIFFGGMCDHEAVPVHAFDPAGQYPRSEARIEKGRFSSELFCDEAVAFIKQRHRENVRSPFFIYLALTSPHDPRTPPPAYARMYAAAEMPVPENFAPGHPFDNGELNIRDELLCPAPRTPADVQRETADYYGMISHHDAQLGRVIAVLQATGEYENTIIVYVSDHGLALGRHGLLGKQNLYEPSVTVPLLLRGPGVPAERTIRQLVYSFDLFPTLCELAGIEAPAGLEGRSLVPLLEEPTAPGRDEIFAFYKNQQAMVTDGVWKLIAYDVAGEVRQQLFDLKQDPLEMVDRVKDAACSSVAADMQRRLSCFQRALFDQFR